PLYCGIGYATTRDRGNPGEQSLRGGVRRPGPSRRAQRAGDRRRAARAGGQGDPRTDRAAGRDARGCRHPHRVPALLRHGAPLRGDERAHAGGSAAPPGRSAAERRTRRAGARARRPARRLLRAHRPVQARGQPEALAFALPARPPRGARAGVARRSRPPAPRAPSGARGFHRFARPSDFLRSLGSTAHRAASRPCTRARSGRAHGSRPRRRAGAMIDHPLRIVGVPGSPYSRKLRAVLRYRRIPHVWVLHGSPEARGLPQPRIPLLPQLIFPGADEAAIDSTPLIRRLESMYAARALIPPDPAMAFLDALLEDYADEWLTKPLFHYRWAFAPD